MKEYSSIKLSEYFDGSYLESIVNELIKVKENGRVWCASVNGHILCSDTVTMDNAFIEVYGMTKDEFDHKHEEQQKRVDEFIEFIENNKERVPSLIERGKAIIFPEKHKEWEIQVIDDVNCALSLGKRINLALDIMEALKSGVTITEAVAILHGNRSKDFYHSVREIVLHFSDCGPDFYQATSTSKLSDAAQKMLSDIKDANSVLAQVHQSDNGNIR